MFCIITYKTMLNHLSHLTVLNIIDNFYNHAIYTQMFYVISLIVIC